MFLSGDSQKDTNGVSSSSFVILFFSGGFNSIFVNHIFFLVSNVFSRTGAPINHPLLAIQLFRSTEDISEDSSFHSQVTQVLLRMLSHSSHLIQPVQSLFSSNRLTVFLLSGP